MRLLPALLAITPAFAAAAAGRAVAQTPTPVAQLVVGGGSATDVRGLSSSAITAAPSVALAWPRGFLRLGATGTQFTTGSWALGGSASAGLRAPIATTPLALTLDAAGSATTTSYRASFATIGATPAIEVGLPRVALFAGVRAAEGRTTLGTIAPATPFASPTTLTHGSFGPVFGGRVTLASLGGGDGVVLGYREDHARVDSVGVTDRVGSLSLVRGPLTLSGNLGVRRAPDERATFAGMSALVALSRVVALQLGAESYPGDRLTGALGGHAISAGFVLRTPSGPRPLPRPNDVAAPARGLTRLAIRAPDARTVEVAGDWTDWRPVPAARAPNRVWYADLAIPAGEHRYAFRIDGKEWRIPGGAIASDDGVGGKSAWLTVSRAAN